MARTLAALKEEVMSHDRPGPDPDVSDAEIVESIVAGAVPVATVADIAEMGNISTTAARQRLERLVESGALCRKDTGATNVYYPDCYSPDAALSSE